MQRVLVPGGRLIFTVWSTPHRDNAALADALRRHVNAEAATKLLAPFAREIAEALPVLEQDVSATLQPYRVGDAFVMPSQAHLVQARVD